MPHYSHYNYDKSYYEEVEQQKEEVFRRNLAEFKANTGLVNLKSYWLNGIMYYYDTHTKNVYAVSQFKRVIRLASDHEVRTLIPLNSNLRTHS
jgi:hypothetical protein